MRPTDTQDPRYYQKVVDCQWACPAHTPVPEYIRLVSQGRYDDAYMVNWQSNVFPGILGRICDRPCEPACRRARVEENNGEHPSPVAICRIKRAAADGKGDVRGRMPKKPGKTNGRRVACVGAGPASLTVARDLAPLGYEVVVFDGEKAAGGFMRSEVPRFRLPEEVIDEEVGYITDLGVAFQGQRRIDSLRTLLSENFDAVFIGCGAPRGRDMDLPGRAEAADDIHIGLDWLASVSFEHIKTVGKRVIVLGGGNTAMDCCRTARRLGGEDVKAIVRSGFAEMKASPWEKEDAIHEGVEILNFMVPLRYDHDGGRLTGMTFGKVEAKYDAKGRRSLVPTGEPDVFVPCDTVLIAVGQENAFPWIERDIGLGFNEDGLPLVDPDTFQSTLPKVFFGGDAAFGPKNIITAVAHGHAAAISIDKLLNGEDVRERPQARLTLQSQKMGLHEWSFRNEVSGAERHAVKWQPAEKALSNLRIEAELGFEAATALKEAERCLNCDVHTVFTASTCIECDACTDVCPMDCITFIPNAEEPELRQQLKAPAKNLAQDLLVSDELKTGRVMVKDEDVCLHCSLCAERCPTGSWDMQKMLLELPYAGPQGRNCLLPGKTA